MLWFPLHKSLQTSNLYDTEKLDHVPELRELYRRKILTNQKVNSMQYLIEIDKDAYDYLEDYYKRNKDSFNKEINEVINLFKSGTFYELFKIKYFWNN